MRLDLFFKNAASGRQKLFISPVDKFFYYVSIFPIFLVYARTPPASSDHLRDRKK